MEKAVTLPHQRPPLATLSAIRALADEIGARFEPHQILLFGSYATGQPGPDSDVDLLVIMPTALTPLRQAVRIAQAVEHRFPLDIIVRTPDQARAAREGQDRFLREVLATGISLYAPSNTRLD